MIVAFQDGKLQFLDTYVVSTKKMEMFLSRFLGKESFPFN